MIQIFTGRKHATCWIARGKTERGLKFDMLDCQMQSYEMPARKMLKFKCRWQKLMCRKFELKAGFSNSKLFNYGLEIVKLKEWVYNCKQSSKN